MYVEKFLQQVHRKLNEQGITNSKLRDTCIDIYEGEIEIFKIDRLYIKACRNRTRYHRAYTYILRLLRSGIS